MVNHSPVVHKFKLKSLLINNNNDNGSIKLTKRMDECCAYGRKKRDVCRREKKTDMARSIDPDWLSCGFPSVC